MPDRVVAITRESRIAIVSATNGEVVRYLTEPQPGGGVSTLSLSWDRSEVYFSRGLGTCAGRLFRVPQSGGRERSMSRPGVPDVVESLPAVSRDGTRIAFRRYYCQQRSRPDLVIGRFGVDGAQQPEVTIPADATRIRWSFDGRLLAFTDLRTYNTINVLDVDAAGTIRAQYHLQPKTGCRYSTFLFRTDSPDLLASELCGPQDPNVRSTFLVLDPRSGAVRDTLLSFPTGLNAALSAFDPSGRHLLYFTGRAPAREGDPSQLYRLTDGRPVLINAEWRHGDALW